MNKNTKSVKGTSVPSTWMNSSSDSCILNKGLRDQDSRYLMPTYWALAFPSLEDICTFDKWLHRASCRHLGLKGQPDISSLALDLCQSSREISLRFNSLVQQPLAITSFLLQTLFKQLGTMTRNSHPLLSNCSVIFLCQTLV